MKLSVMFIIAAVYGLLIGLPLLFGPSSMATAAGLTGSPGMLMTLRYMGVANIGLGLIAWLVRNSEPSGARDGASMGFFIFFALSALTSLYAQFTEAAMVSNWIYVVVQALIAVGFFAAGKANMSTAKK